MILVTVGTHDQGFDRLIKGADELAAEIDEKIIIQRGVSFYEPHYAEHFRWTTSDCMERLTEESRLVISQAAAGAIIVAIKYNKPIIIVPRLKFYGENWNDHQKQLAIALSLQNKAIFVEEPTSKNLLSALDRINDLEISQKGALELVNSLKQQLTLWKH